MDPRIQVTDQDMQAWYREASVIERTECTLSRAAAMLAELERLAAQLEAGGKGEAAGAVRGELRAVTLILRGDPRDPGHVNLSGRINWLTIQVGNYSGRPTKGPVGVDPQVRGRGGRGRGPTQHTSRKGRGAVGGSPR